MREIEIKLRAPDLAIVAKKLRALGCVLSEAKTQEDRNFVHKDDVRWFDSTTHRHWVYPRLRIQKGKPLILTVKKPINNEMDCVEHELQVGDARAVAEIMKMFDYYPGVTVKKTRRTTKYKNYSITLDKVEKLGNFVEIERVVKNGNAEKIQNEMFRWAKEVLGLDRDDLVMKGYDIMMHNKTRYPMSRRNNYA